MSIQALTWVLSNSESTGTTRNVMFAIANHVSPQGEGWAYRSQILADANCSLDSYKRAIQWAEEHGEIERVEKAGGSDRTRADMRPNLFRMPALLTDDDIPPSLRERGGQDATLVDERGGQDAPQGGGQDATLARGADCTPQENRPSGTVLEPSGTPPSPPPPDGDGSASQQAEEADPAGLPSQLDLRAEDGSEAAPRVLSRSEMVTEVTTRLLKVWGEATGRERVHKVTADRKRKVSARLADGFTEEDLEQAIRGMALDSFLRGGNDRGKRYDTFEIAVRDGERVERYRDDWREHLDHGPRRERRSGGQSATDRAMDIIAGRS